MIPKIIHYTWFSTEPYPDEVQQCIDSWRVKLPGYELKLWNYDSVKEIKNDFLQEALSVKKWAYAADFIRLYALYNEGGIYLDTDVMVYDTFDDVLEHKAFIGKESSVHFVGSMTSQYLTSHCMGSVPKHPFIKDCLDYYADRRFILSDNPRMPLQLRYNYITIPYIQAEIARVYGYDWRPLTQSVQLCQEGLVVYPSECFDATKHGKQSKCCHLALGSWRDDKPRIYNYTLKYKIRWRIIRVFQWVLEKFDFMTVELE